MTEIGDTLDQAMSGDSGPVIEIDTLLQPQPVEGHGQDAGSVLDGISNNLAQLNLGGGPASASTAPMGGGMGAPMGMGQPSLGLNQLDHVRTVTVVQISGRAVFGPQELPATITIRELKDMFGNGLPAMLMFGRRILADGESLQDLASEVTLSVCFDAPPLLFAEGEINEELAERFLPLAQIGSGTFATVFMAARRDSNPQSFVAIKRISMENEEDGIPGTAIREISVLKELNHPNVVRLLEVYDTRQNLFLVFELLDMDLHMYIKRNGAFSNTEALMKASHQCFAGLQCCHVRRILHRDLKPQNILVDVATMTLKITDFGLARAFTLPLKPYTHEVITLWYRAPELLLGQVCYGLSLDIWSMGCILAEMATGRALFPGDSEIDTLFKIFRMLGTPTVDVWPRVNELPEFREKRFPKWRNTHFADVIARAPSLGANGAALLGLCLTYNPDERPLVRRLAKHAFFEGV